MSDLDDFPETTASATPKTGATIGPYKLLEQIGEGGMGSVWVASQSEPIKRRVAIKLIKAGMDTGQVLARFEAERQALAMMDHPNIARVLDGGMTDQGRPYFAMEYVKGVPLTEYCDNAKLSLKERLELFVPVCQAVQHAHQKGIIHRDLKPSNILVCLYDGKPVPKVIDFGLAKAMHQSLTDQSIYTAHGMMVGTPLYMSPEQAELNNLDIDTRTDIYALGVILYELLTGTTPLEKAQMKQAAYDEVLRLIKEVEPPKPSLRLSGSESLPSVAAQRGIEPAQLTKSITGDLDWVVMKALEKERSRRYETANGLAEDIRRHLADEPVSASPPSTSYRVRKFIKRNRAGVIAASAIAITLLLGVAGTTGGMLWALTERKEAVAAREAETDARQEALTNASLAKEEADRATAAEQKTAETLKAVEAERDAKEVALKDAEQISEFLTDVFQSPDPTKDGREIKVVELLDNAAKKLQTDLVDQPFQRAKLQESLAATYFNLGLYKSAIPLWEQVRDYHLATSGPEGFDTLSAMQRLGNAYSASHRTDEAIPLLEEALKLSRKVSGRQHPNTVAVMHSLATSYSVADRNNEALMLFEEGLDLSREVNSPDHSATSIFMNNLANTYYRAGRVDEALKMREEVLELSRKVNGLEHADTLLAMNGLANSYLSASRVDEALELGENAVALGRKLLGLEHNFTLSAMGSLANSYRKAGRVDESLELHEVVLAQRRKVFGLEHPATLTTMSALASSYTAAGRREEALKLREETLELCRKGLSPEHPVTLSAMNNLGILYRALGRDAEALSMSEEVLELRRKVLGPMHPDTRSALNIVTSSALTLSARYVWESKFEEHADLIRRLTDLVSESKTHTAHSRTAKIACLVPDGDSASYQNAVRLARKALELGKDDKNFPYWGNMALGMALYRTENFDEAEQVLSMNKQLGETSSFFRSMALFRQGKDQAARDLFAAAKAKMTPLPEADEDILRDAGADQIITWLAYREADALINK